MNSEFVQLTRCKKISEEVFYPVMNRMYEHLWEQAMPPQLVMDGLSNLINNNVVTPPDTPIPDCLTCGACCQAHLCVGVRPSDTVDPELYWEITVATEDGEIVVDRYMKRNEETLACTALDGTIGDHVACRIYETRPKMCHHFDAGSDRCHAVRRAWGIEPFLKLDEMSDALKKLDASRANTDRSQIIRNTQIRPDASTGEFVITALMENNDLRELHRYDPDIENWMQFELEGLSLDKVTALLCSRKAQ